MNLQRRVILFGAIALPFVPLAARMLPGSAMASNRAEQLVLVLQSGLLESERFVQSWGSRHSSVIDFQGDIGVLLYERLVPMWREQGATAVAGLTSVSSFFCVSQVAADHGLRVLHRGVHHALHGRIQHEVDGAPSMADPTAADWPSQSARIAMQAMDRVGERRALSQFELLPQSELAFASWLMVPRSWLAA
jgi:hypothetical protein